MITEKMIVLDIVEKYPNTEEVFRTYDTAIGKCLLCCELFESVEHIAKKYELNLKEMLENLNKSNEMVL